MNFGNSSFWRSRLSKTARGGRPYFFLTLLASALCLPGLFMLPLVDSTEGACAQIARQTAQSGSYLQLHYQNKAISQRPAGNYWLQALSVRIFGLPNSVWPYRLPSFITILLSSWLIFLIGKTLFTPERGLLASLLFLITPATIIAGQTALSAALCTMLLTLNALSLALTYRHNSRRHEDLRVGYILLFWVSMGLNTLCCGLFALMPSIGVLLALRLKEGSFSNFRGLFPFWGILCGILFSLPWLYALKLTLLPILLGAPNSVYSLHLLLLGGDYSSWRLPWINLPSLLLLLWPIIFFLLQTIHLLQRKRSNAGIFCFGWLLPILLTGLSLPYVAPLLILPALPGLCLLCAEFILSPERMSNNSLLRGLVWTACLLGALLPLIATALFAAGVDTLFELPLAGYLLLAPALLIAIAALWYISQGARLRLCLICLCFSMLSVPVLTIGVLPALRAHWLPLLVTDSHVKDNAGDSPDALSPTRLVCLGLPCPEIVFYVGADTILTEDPLAAADHLLTNPGDSLVVLEKYNEALKQALHDRRLSAELTKTIRGFYATDGEIETAYFYKKVSPIASPAPKSEGLGYPEDWETADDTPEAYWRPRQ